MTAPSTGCKEYQRLSRRQFLRGATGTFGLAAIAPAWLPQVVYAQDFVASRDVMVSIFLRGGADGLTLCFPHGDANYYATGLRPNIGIPPPGSSTTGAGLDLNGFFGFPQAMSALLPAYQAGHLLPIHATGSTDPTHSHFEAQQYMEAGVPEDPDLATGWLGRHLMSAPPVNPTAPLRATCIGDNFPQTLEGANNALPVPNLSNFALAGTHSTQAARLNWLMNAYSLVDDPIRAATLTTNTTMTMLSQLNFAQYAPGGGATYPTSTFGTAMMSAAALIKAQVGVEAIHIDLQNWDTHHSEGPIDGDMFTLMQDFSGSLAAFHADIFSGSVTNVTVAVVSEFGRTVQENDSQGVDHGHGNVMFLLGQNITGGRVLSNWPGLATEQLYNGTDLQVTIDYRDILAEVVQNCLGNSDLSFVFPDYTPTFRGVTK